MSDHERPLNARGRRAATLMAHHLLDQQIAVDIILASTAERVRETLELMQVHWAHDVEVLRKQSLYLSSRQQTLQEIQSLHDSWASALVVAHNPSMVALACDMAQADVDMPTAAIAIFDVDVSSWSQPISPDLCHLRAHWKPRDLET